MSVNKKRDRALQQRVRDRQAKTGESYQTAWRHLTADPSSPSNAPARRVPLPFSIDVKVMRDQSAQITTHPQLESFWPDRLLIKNADHWRVEELFVGDASETWKSPHLKRSLLEGSREVSSFALDTWHPLTSREVICGENLVLIVTFIGDNEEGERLEASVFGWEGRPPPASATALPFDQKPEVPEQDEKLTKSPEICERFSESAKSARVAVNKTITLPLIVTTPRLFVDRLTITDAKDWVVNDILTRGKSIFMQKGELPGEMFSDSARVILEPLAAKDRVELVATYVGNSASACLSVELSGTAKAASEPRVVSHFLPMSSGIPIEPMQSVQITGTPQMNFLAERVVIADPDAWIINNIKIGMRCQQAEGGDLPGQSFSSRVVGGHVSLDLVRKGQRFVMIATRGEDCKQSAGFYCGVQGQLVQAA